MPRATTTTWLIDNTDFAPTLLEIAGAETPDYMRGKSFAAVLREEPKPDDWREAVYYRYWMHMEHDLEVPAHFGIRTDRYKLIFFYGIDFEGSGRAPKPRPPAAWEFYDLEKDPSEMINRYDEPAYQDIIAEMKVRLRVMRGSNYDEHWERWSHPFGNGHMGANAFGRPHLPQPAHLAAPLSGRRHLRCAGRCRGNAPTEPRRFHRTSPRASHRMG